MRILMVHNFYRQKIVGGEDIVFKRELEGLSANLGKDDVLSYTVNTDDTGLILILSNVFFSPIHFFRVFYLVKRRKIDIVHFHNFFPVLSSSVFFAAKWAGAKTVLTLHNYRIWCAKGILYRSGSICLKCIQSKSRASAIKYRCFQDSLWFSLAATFSLSFYKYIGSYRKIDCFFALTQFQKNFLTSNRLIDEGRILIKPNFVTSPSNRGNRNSKDYDFAFIGRLEESKGQQYLWEMIKSFPECRFLVIGFANEKEQVAFSQQSNVRYFERLPNETTMELLSKCRFLLQLSLWYETFGLTIIEAMSIGVPVLGFSIGTRIEFLADGKNGFVLDERDIGRGVQRALSLTNDLYAEMSLRCIDFASDYKMDSVINQQIDAYSNLLG